MTAGLPSRLTRAARVSTTKSIQGVLARRHPYNLGKREDSMN